MLSHMFLDEWQNDISALHDASSEYDHFRIVGVDERNRVNRPNIQTMLLDYAGDCISVSSCGEERLKINLRYAGKAGFVESWCLPHYPWQ
jgi:hypothetical protein